MKQIRITKAKKGVILFISSFLVLMFLVFVGCASKPTSIHRLASWGKGGELEKRLVSRPKDVNLETASGLTPLHMAAFIGRIDIVELLISNGASINAQDNRNETPLHKAALGGQAKVIQFLIDNGATVNSVNIGGRTPLALVTQCQLKSGMTIEEVNECIGFDLPAPIALSAHGKTAVFQDKKGRYSYYSSKDYRFDSEAIARDGCPYTSDFDSVTWMEEAKHVVEDGQFRFNRRFNRIEGNCVLVKWPEGMSLDRRKAVAEMLRKYGGK